ncbi:hypothetical protein [Brumicola pallidula]|nr:hypothetical protein [Glaciecola pallidula]
MRKASIQQKRPIFYVIAVLLPFAMLLLVEGVLRITGFGHSYPLFITSNYSQDYLQPNPDVVKRFFHQPLFAPPVGPDTFLFAQNKDPDSIRIVLMGGSTAAGFPYGRFGSPAGMLNQRVKAQFPNSRIEIISVAMASINSYALLDFVDEVIAIEPDAVLIYAGHNEYLGIMGVGSMYASNGSHAANLLFLIVKEWRTFQLMQSLYYGLFQSSADKEHSRLDHSGSSRTVMASVAKEKDIAFASVLFEQGAQQFEQNLLAIQSALITANIPVYVSTIASNEKDLPPFSSSNTVEEQQFVDNANTRSNRRIIQQGVTLLNKGSTSATLAYEVAKAMSLENDQRAAEFFLLANNYDLLRFRAPSIFNDIIRKTANSQDLSFLVDSERAIRNDTSDGIIGAKHMLEHLHPTARGYFLIADAFYQQLLDNSAFENSALESRVLENKTLENRILQSSPLENNPFSTPNNVKVALLDLLSIEHAWRNMPLSDVDQLVGDYKIQILTSDYPFTDIKKRVALPSNKTALEQIAKRRIEGESWLTSQQALLLLLQQQGNISEAAKAAGVLYDALPNENEVARIASLLYLQIDEFGLAEFYARRALLVSNNGATMNANYYLTLAEIVFKSGDVLEAISVLNRLLEIEPDNKRAMAIKQQISS